MLSRREYGSSYQQSLNEVFATNLHRQQDFERYTAYYPVKLTVEGGMEGIGCMCYDFCSDRVESISAWEVLQTGKLRQNESFYYPFKKACLALGMPEAEFDHFLDYQIMTDYLLSNTDRHMNNIALLRDPDTLKILGFAPIFDSGNSMFYNVPYEQLSTLHIGDIRTHSFVEKESRLLQYVRDRSVVSLDRAEQDFSIYESDTTERRIRIPLIQELYEKKREALRNFQKGKDIWKQEKYRK